MERRSEVAGVARAAEFLPAATAGLRELVRAAYGLSGGEVWGNRTRARRAISRGRRRGKGSSKSLVIVRIKSAVSCRGRGRDLGKDVSAGVMTGGSHLSATASERAGCWAAGWLLGYARAADSYGPRPTQLRNSIIFYLKPFLFLNTDFKYD